MLHGKNQIKDKVTYIKPKACNYNSNLLSVCIFQVIILEEEKVAHLIKSFSKNLKLFM